MSTATQMLKTRQILSVTIDEPPRSAQELCLKSLIVLERKPSARPGCSLIKLDEYPVLEKGLMPLVALGVDIGMSAFCRLFGLADISQRMPSGRDL